MIPIVTVAALVPSMLATIMLLTLTKVSDAAVSRSVVVVVVNAPHTDSPVIEETLTKFGAAIIFS